MEKPGTGSLSVNESCSGAPLALNMVPAGFPSPADDPEFRNIDLNRELIKNKSSTFLIRVSGNSMIDAGIQSNDILIVDQSLTPRHGDIVLAIVENSFTVKRLITQGKKPVLLHENQLLGQEYSVNTEFIIRGVVTCAIKVFRGNDKPFR